MKDQDLTEWNKWLLEVQDLETFRIGRCLKPAGFSYVEKCEIHHFVDASELGYGVTSYLRILNGCGEIHCVLLTSKARVVPLKKITIPRLELTAATLAVKQQVVLSGQLQYVVHDVFYWTDSMAVLRYIWNTSTLFHTYVANRLAVIHEGSDTSQWRYVPSEVNVADDVSRGLQVDQLVMSKRWINGPEFLWSDTQVWPEQPTRSNVPDKDLEVKTTNVADVSEVDVNRAREIEQESNILSDVISRCSSPVGSS